MSRTDFSVGLRFKLLAPFLGAVLVFAAAIHFLWLPAHLRDARDDFRLTQRHMLEVLKPALTGPLLSQDIVQVYAMLGQVQHTTPHWVSIVLEDPKGRRLYPLEALPVVDGDQTIWFDEPLKYQTQVLGRLRVAADATSVLQAQSDRIRSLELWLLLLTTASCLAFAALQGRMVLRPLLRLAVAAERLAEDDFRADLPEPSNDEMGHLIHAFEAMRDKRELAEAQAQRAGNVLREALDALDEAFVLYDQDDRLVFCNEKYRRLYSKSADLIVPGASFEEIVRAGAERGQYVDAVGRVDEWVAERLAAHRAANTMLLQQIDGGQWLRIIERRMPEGYTVGFRIDVTDLMNATEAAQAASRSKSQFLANMSHELRTPMNAILGMLALLQNTPLNAKQLDYATKSEGAARSLLGLLNDILDFSKVEAGKLALDPKPFKVERLFSDLSVILMANLGNKPVKVLFDVDPAVPAYVLGDDMRLQQVLINLGGNAIKFTETGEVVVGLSVLERHENDVLLKFSVKDSGIGIAPENQEHIFSGFSQAEASTTRRFGGTGLGLTISQRLLALMGGTLSLDSVVGQGSTFSFQLRFAIARGPAEEDLKQKALAPEQRFKAKRLQGMRLLVVEDNANNRQVAQELLSEEGAMVELAENGQLGVQAVAQAAVPFDVVLMDVQMPVMDGFTAAGKIRNELGLKDLPIVAMTANAMSSDRDECLAAGMNDHVGKPFDLSALVATLLRQSGRQVTVVEPASPGLNDLPAEFLQESQRRGLEIAAALSRMGGNRGVYLRVLPLFCKDLKTLSAQVEDLLAQGQKQQARRVIHSLKGLAGSMGLQPMASLSASLEKQLASDLDAASVNLLLAQLSEGVQRTLDDIEFIQTTLQPDETGVSARMGDTDGVMPDLALALQELSGLLKAADMSAVDVFEQIQEAYGVHLKEALKPLAESMASLNFGTALEQCQALIRLTHRAERRTGGN